MMSTHNESGEAKRGVQRVVKLKGGRGEEERGGKTRKEKSSLSSDTPLSRILTISLLSSKGSS